MITPHRLWSLRDMLNIYAHEYLNLGRNLEGMVSILSIAASSDGDSRNLDAEEKATFLNSLRFLASKCGELGLSTAQVLAANAINDLPQTARELNIIMSAVEAELKGKLFLFVPADRAIYYAKQTPSNVAMAFPMASLEIIEAGNCYAAGVYTACVFHSMRAAEVGVRTLGKSLGVTFDFDINLAEWHNLLDQIESKIKEMKSLKKGVEKDEKLQFYSEAAAQFRYFKDGWRTRVAHARAIYSEPQAKTVLDHVSTFFAALSTDLREQ